MNKKRGKKRNEHRKRIDEQEREKGTRKEK